MDERNKGSLTSVIVGIVAFSGGIALGYFFGKKHEFNYIRDQFADLSRRKAEFNRDKTTFNKEREAFDEYSNDKSEQARSRMEEAHDLIVRYRNDQDRPDPSKIIVVHEPESGETKHQPNLVNVFAGEDSDWNYEAELSTRVGDVPYILHVDEFMEDSMHFHQATFTYFKGDDILVDETDTPVYNYVATVGELRFGHGSKDPNVVYVRNEPLECEYEILMNVGHYTVEILGQEMEENLTNQDLKHAAHSIPKFRRE